MSIAKKSKTANSNGRGKRPKAKPAHDAVAAVLEKNLEDVTTILADTSAKSRLYEDVLQIVERSLCRIALTRNKGVKSRAADYLGISRNTFQNKLVKLGIEDPSDS